ncbi:hypothetical protein Tco_0625936 [Tanacetum coccineum]|uniref:Uncharacterized protein n=1 Tax=Tanacetum coccineum TaxID=301880 RepID=A0ABQ4WIC3_9ASTR
MKSWYDLILNVIAAMAVVVKVEQESGAFKRMARENQMHERLVGSGVWKMDFSGKSSALIVVELENRMVKEDCIRGLAVPVYWCGRLSQFGEFAAMAGLNSHEMRQRSSNCSFHLFSNQWWSDLSGWSLYEIALIQGDCSNSILGTESKVSETDTGPWDRSSRTVQEGCLGLYFQTTYYDGLFKFRQWIVFKIDAKKLTEILVRRKQRIKICMYRRQLRSATSIPVAIEQSASDMAIGNDTSTITSDSPTFRTHFVGQGYKQVCGQADVCSDGVVPEFVEQWMLSMVHEIVQRMVRDAIVIHRLFNKDSKMLTLDIEKYQQISPDMLSLHMRCSTDESICFRQRHPSDVEVLQKSFEELKKAKARDKKLFEEAKEENRKQYEEKLKFHALTMKEEMVKEANAKIAEMFAQYTQNNELPIPPS